MNDSRTAQPVPIASMQPPTPVPASATAIAIAPAPVIASSIDDDCPATGCIYTAPAGQVDATTATTTLRKAHDYHHHSHSYHKIAIPSAVLTTTKRSNTSTNNATTQTHNCDAGQQQHLVNNQFCPTGNCKSLTSSPNSKKLKVAGRPGVTVSSRLYYASLLIHLTIFLLFVRGQVYIASTFAGTRPYRGVPAPQPIFKDAKLAWKDCASIIAANLPDIGDAGRIWLRHAYVGTNLPPDTESSSADSLDVNSSSSFSSSSGSEQLSGTEASSSFDNRQAGETGANQFIMPESLTSAYKSTFASRVDEQRDQYQCRCLQPQLHVSEMPRMSAIVQSFNHYENVGNISTSLKAAEAVDEVIICEDGSTDGSLFDWKKKLMHDSHFIIRSNNLHEMRSYNRALRIASGDIIVLLQDDDLLPRTDEWIRSAQKLFAALPDLGVLGGYIGQTWDYDSGIGNEFGDQISSHGGVRDGDTKPLPFVEPKTNIPFTYAECTWIAPLFIRKEVLSKVGGLDLSIAKRGEPGVWQDCVFSYDAWIHGFTVGTFHAPFERGVGGHGSASSEMKIKLRGRVYGRAVGHANRKFPRRRVYEAVQTLNAETLLKREKTSP